MSHETRPRIQAILADASSLSPLLERLKRAGLAEDQIHVLSTRPVAVELESGAMHLVVVAFIAGLVGVMIGVWLTAGTAISYPIRTGGKPIVALPVVGLISYEVMMLCAIVATVVALVWRIRAGFRTGRDGPALTGDQVAVTIHLPPEDERTATIHAILAGVAPVELCMGEGA